ncbi:hypothetical protein Tco_1306135, partial [Tanacetum coccineum]
VEKKKRKYTSICEENGYKFIPFAFSTFGKFDTEAVDTLSRIKSIFISRSNNAKNGVFIFHRMALWTSQREDHKSDSLTTIPISGMVDFVPGRAVIDVAQRKRDKYTAKCASIGYGFLPFSFSSLGELEADAVTLLKRIRKFSMTQDIGARAAVHIFNRMSFAIAKGVGTQIVSRLPSNLL